MFVASLVMTGFTQAPPAQPPTQPPAGQQPPAKPPAKPQARQPAPSARQVLTITVTNLEGRTLPGVWVKATGPVDRETPTDDSGMVVLHNMLPGTYRVRFEHDDYVTFEREVTQAARALAINVALNAAPPKSAPAPAPPPPQPVATTGVGAPAATRRALDHRPLREELCRQRAAAIHAGSVHVDLNFDAAASEQPACAARAR